VAPVRLRLGQTNARHHPGELAAGQDVRGHDGVRDYNVRTEAASTGATSTSLRRSIRLCCERSGPRRAQGRVRQHQSTPSRTVCRRAGPGATLWDSTRSRDEARVYLRRIRWSWPGPMAHGPMEARPPSSPGTNGSLGPPQRGVRLRARSRMGETETSSSGRRCCNVTAGLACHCMTAAESIAIFATPRRRAGPCAAQRDLQDRGQAAPLHILHGERLRPRLRSIGRRRQGHGPSLG
jgi:hypothetical protein